MPKSNGESERESSSVSAAELEARLTQLEYRMATAQRPAATGADYGLPPGQPLPAQPRGGDSECCGDECEPQGCCALEFVFKRTRILSGQKGIDRSYDGETTTGVTGASGGLEVQFFADVDGSGIIVPNQIWGFMKLSKQANKPGIWHEVDRTIRVLYAPCGGKARMVNYSLQAVEREVGTVEVAGLGKDEFGQVTGRVPISCCGEPVEHRTEITLHGGGDGEGTIEVIFEVRPKR